MAAPASDSTAQKVGRTWKRLKVTLQGLQVAEVGLGRGVLAYESSCFWILSKGELGASDKFAHLPQHLPRFFVGEGLLWGRRHQLCGAGQAFGAVEIATLEARNADASQQWACSVLARLGHPPHEAIAEAVGHAAVLRGGNLQVGRRQARMGDKGLHFGASGSSAVAESVGEDEIGQLGLLVPRPSPSREGGPTGVVSAQISAVLLEVLLVQGLLAIAATIAGSAGVVHNTSLSTQRDSLLE
mmetsp:Transcript_68811/g.143708  ORF Transcript_68811/g.143708 Transcript_68811/m.143708 type:complete len:242 (+) Transcript_68811:202-927(+)